MGYKYFVSQIFQQEVLFIIPVSDEYKIQNKYISLTAKAVP
jgi:hypothetical protein